MRYSKLITISSLLIAMLLLTFIGCDKRTFSPDQFEIISLTSPDTLYSGFEGKVEALVVTKEGVPAEAQTITFKTDVGVISAKAVTNEFGIAQATYYHNVADTLVATIEASIQKSKVTTHTTVIPFEGEYGITSLTAQPAMIYADNNVTMSTIRAMVKDKSGVGVVDETVRFSSNIGQVTVFAQTDNFGVATAEFGDNLDEGLATITAMIDKSVRTVEVMIEPVTADYTIIMSADPELIYADNNITYSTIKARVIDRDGFPVVEELVRFKTSLGAIISLVYTDEMGVASTTFWDAGEIGTAVIEAHIGGSSASINVEVVETPPIESIEIITELNDLSLETQMNLRAFVVNTLGEPVSDGTIVTFTATKGFFIENNFATTSNGQASVPFDTGTSAGTFTVTARIGTVIGTREGNINPGPPAYISLLPQKRDSLDVWVNMPPEGIPVNFPRDVRIRATVRDMFNNPVPRVQLEFETNLAGIQPYAETDDSGVTFAAFFPGTSAGSAQITSRTIQMGEGGEPIMGLALITIYSDEVQSIAFTIQEEIFLDVQGVGGIESRPLRVELRDFGGNLVSGQHWVRYEIMGNNPPPGVNINNVGLMDEVQANNGIAIASINSGTGSGTVIVRVSLIENPAINATKTNIVVRSGPPSTVQPTIGDFDTGVSMGGGLWRVEAGAMVRDQYGNPVINGTAVWFSIDDPSPAQVYIDGSGYTGNPTPTYEDGSPGFAGTFLYYHGIHIYSVITIRAESGEIEGTQQVTLPAQQPRMEIVVEPGHHDYFANDPDNAFQDGDITVSLTDGQGNPITNGIITMTSTHGLFMPFQWFDGSGNNINAGLPANRIRTYNGFARGTIRSRIWECPPPVEEYFTTVDVQVNAFLIGTNTIAQTSFTIRRYIIPFPGR